MQIIGAAQTEPTLPQYSDSLIKLIAVLSGPGFAIGISQLLETIPQWHAIQNKTIKYVASVVFGAVGMIAGYLLASNPEIAALPQNHPTLAVVLVAVGVAIMQIYHALTKATDTT